MEKLFDNILDKDEQIVKVFKPKKKKLYFSVFVSSIISMFFIMLFIVGPIMLGLSEEYSETQAVPLSTQIDLVLLIALGVFVLIILFIWMLTAIYYKNLYLAYSNKRVIIRSGIFGVDYRSLDMSMIGAINVYVSLLDKILRSNTGTITFGSMASPMYSQANGGSIYRFAHIVNPYEVYKEVKNIIDEFKAAKK